MFYLKKKIFKKHIYKYIVTSGMPYSNGELHLGHIMEKIQADIWVRFMRLQNLKVYFISGDDNHGAPILIKSIKNNISKLNLIKNTLKDHIKNIKYFKISFNNYYYTHSKGNKNLVNKIFLNLKKKNLIKKKKIKLPFDKKLNIFLPDRFIKRICPYCYEKNQIEEICIICKKSFYKISQLKLCSVISNSIIIYKKTTHFFLKISHYKCYFFLKKWILKLKKNFIKNKLLDIIGKNKNNIIDWDITRDSPYWGFKILKKKNKYFYVWFDALIGYYSNLINFFKKKKIKIKKIIKENFFIKQYHFIGKDILQFHGIYLPIILKFNNFNTSKDIFTHGFLKINGEKMSKSKNNYISANNYIKLNLNPDFIRYYFSLKLNSKINDINFNINEFNYYINKNLIGKYINIPSRIFNFLNKYFKKKISNFFMKNIFYKKFFIKTKILIKNFKKRNYDIVNKNILNLLNKINKYIEKNKPWKLKNYNLKKLHKIISVTLESYRIISIMLKPIIPNTIKFIENFLNIKKLNFKKIKTTLKKKNKLNYFKSIIRRIEKDKLNDLLNLNEKKY